MKNYKIKVLSENIDSLLLKLITISGLEIRNVGRKNGFIQVKTNTLDQISFLNEILTIEKDTKFYINRIAIL